VLLEIAGNFPSHEKPEGDAEEDEARNINGREGPELQSGQERLVARHRTESEK
jgi:hypothetical protein